MKISTIDFIESLPTDLQASAFDNIQGGTHLNNRALTLEAFGFAFAKGSLMAYTSTNVQIRLFNFSYPAFFSN